MESEIFSIFLVKLVAWSPNAEVSLQCSVLSVKSKQMF